MSKPNKKRLTSSTSDIIESISTTSHQSTAEDREKLEIRKQLVLTRSLDDQVKKYILKASFERGERLSFNGLIIELLENLIAKEGTK